MDRDDRTAQADRRIVETVSAIAGERDVPPAQIALAWVSSKSVVTAPIVGASKPSHMTDAVASLDISPSPEETRRLEELYIPRAVAGFS